jgi:hypothetical protein
MMIFRICPLLPSSVSVNLIPPKKAPAKYLHQKARVMSLQVPTILGQMSLLVRVLLEPYITTTTTPVGPHLTLALHLRQENTAVPLVLGCLRQVKRQALAMPKAADHHQLQVRMSEATLSTLARFLRTSMLRIFTVLEHKVNLIGSKKHKTITRTDTTQPLGTVDMMMKQGEATPYLTEEPRRHYQTTSTHHTDLPVPAHTLGLALATTIVAACTADRQV